MTLVIRSFVVAMRASIRSTGLVLAGRLRRVVGLLQQVQPAVEQVEVGLLLSLDLVEVGADERRPGARRRAVAGPRAGGERRRPGPDGERPGGQSDAELA